MRRQVTIAMVLLAAGGLAMARAGEPAAGFPERDPELAREPSWRPPSLPEIRRRALEWVRRSVDEAEASAATARVEVIWDRLAAQGATGDVVDAALETAATIEPRAAAVREAAPRPGTPDLSWLVGTSASDFGSQAVRLWLGRELVRRDRFDEALPLLEGLDVAASVDPATLLFLRGCCQHWMLAREAAVESFDRLLEREEQLPARYARLARLLRADIATVETDTLDHVARRMRDVRRRLDLGRAGPDTRLVQKGVIESLDRLIEELERQQQEQQGQAGATGTGGGGQGGAAGRPMEDSRIARGPGRGEVRKRDLGDGQGWGDLPPHEREAALQQIGREYPPHYRDAIEEYFKRLATGGGESP